MTKKRPEAGIDRDVVFALAYVRNNCNGTRAARAAGYSGSSATLRARASRMLRKDNVQETLARLRHEMTMDALEALQRMSDIARGSMEDFLDKDNHIDLKKARRGRRLHLLKTIREKEWMEGQGEEKTRVVERRIELYPADGALKTMMQFLGLLEATRRDVPKDPREMDAMLVAELIRVKGKVQGEALARAMGILPGEPPTVH